MVSLLIVGQMESLSSDWLSDVSIHLIYLLLKGCEP